MISEICIGWGSSKLGLFQAVLEKVFGQNWENWQRTSLGEVNDIEHNKVGKIYSQNQVILDSIMSSNPRKHKYIWYGSMFLIGSIIL